MRIFMDGHGIEQALERGIDLSMLLAEELKNELKNLLNGQKLIKENKGTTIVFKKSNSSDTIYIKTAWAKYPPANNANYGGNGCA